MNLKQITKLKKIKKEKKKEMKKPRRRGLGAAVCLDNSGVYLGSSALVIEGVGDPAIMEAITCPEALCLAEDQQINQVHHSL